VISYGLDLTQTSIFVVTEWHAAIGTPVSVRLSFPRILEPIDIPARISDIRIAGEPGELGGIRLTFDGGSREVAATLKALLERVNAPCCSSTTARWCATSSPTAPRSSSIGRACSRSITPRMPPRRGPSCSARATTW
jgi:hypothetical protein